ncbi:ABC transporter permease [Halocatena marina]|uniref:ABC transporter permease n=1 Tax=Halocatena marina TaxID=2934937 RepID=UPI00200D7FDA|nr:ABC transporter permease [Halocatena marina]
MTIKTATNSGQKSVNNSFRTDVWANFMRWGRKLVRNPFALVGSLIQPVIFLILFLEVFGQVMTDAVSRGSGTIVYESFLLPAIVIMVSLTGAATSGTELLDDINYGIFEKVLVSPMSRAGIFLGKTLAEMTMVTVQIVIILVLGWLFGATFATGVWGGLVIIGIGIVFAGWYVGFSIIVALLTRDSGATVLFTNLLVFPLLFLSSAFLPVETLPGWIQIVSSVNPVTYGVDATRALIITGWSWDVILSNLAVLIGLDLVFGAIAVRMLTQASGTDVA